MAALGLVAVACDGRSDWWEGDEVDTYCRERPAECDFEIGGFCVVTDDCNDGVCCRDPDCGGGMCLYMCRIDADCPPSQACEDGYCFFRCTADAQCGPGQKCEHGHTVCQYE